MQASVDMTRGNPRRLLLGFALPIIATNMLQQLYNVADSAVIGQLLGTEAFASVGAAGWLYWAGLSLLIGLTQGFSIVLAQRFGAGDMPGLRRAMASSAYLMLAFTALLSLSGVFLARAVLLLLNTPHNIVDGAVIYLQYLFAGLLITGMYNMMAASLRAMGNSRAPLIAVIIASILNIGLNFLFVLTFKMAIAGVAIATLLSQLFACVFCYVTLYHVKDARLTRPDWRQVDRKTLRSLMAMGAPLALRNGIIALGGLAVQYVINGFGYLFVAGTTAARRLTGFMEQIGTGLDGAVRHFVGQNVGAGETERARTGVRTAVRISLVCALVLMIAIPIFARPLLGIFITDGTGISEALSYGEQYLIVFACATAVLYLSQIFRAALEGMGDTVTPMLASLIELAVRILSVFLLPMLFGIFGVYIADPISWLFAGLLLLMTYKLRTRQPKLY